MTTIQERLRKTETNPYNSPVLVLEAADIIDKLVEALLIVRNDVKFDQGRLSDMAFDKVCEALKAVKGEQQ